MIWPAIECGKEQVISCYDGAENGQLTRRCEANGEWSTTIGGSCQCSSEFYMGVAWPTTAAGASASSTCQGQSSQKRTRACLPNGEWDDQVVGSCTCQAERYPNVQWYETMGGTMAVHECDIGADGEGYRRQCKVDGTWENEVTGSCVCPTSQTYGFTWEAAIAGTTQVENCAEGALGESMSRTCGIYGSWERVQGSCDCPQEEVEGVLYPQTHSGYEARVSCAEGAIGQPFTRACLSRGQWGEIQTGSCSCPEQIWTNYAGTSYHFAQTAGANVASLTCALDATQKIERTCSLFGEWSEPQGCEETVYCPAETVGQLSFQETAGGSAMMIPCAGSDTSMSYGRFCHPNGQWGDVVGYCECPAEEDRYGLQWEVIRSERQTTQACAEGYSGTITRECDFFGVWHEQDHCQRNVCPSEELDGVTWPQTNSMEMAEEKCGSNTIQRYCTAEGEWAEVSGSCQCESTFMNGHYLSAAGFGNQHSFSCPSGYRGEEVYECRGRGVWVRVSQCEVATCLPEEFADVHWPETQPGSSASVACLSSTTNRLTRYCNSNGKWSTSFSGTCGCDPVNVNESGLYTFTANSATTVTLPCVEPYYGTISRTCTNAGEWSEVDNQCQIRTCPAETVNGVDYPVTNAGTTFFLPCEESAVGTGYSRVCTMSGTWESPAGSCSCPPDEVRHVDGHLYVFAETAANSMASQLCGGDLAGSITRSCSLLGGWHDIRGECLRLQCPEESMNGYVWPATNSSTTVEQPCHEYQIGSVSRTCHAAGMWSEPQSNCFNRQCETLQMTRLANGSMNIKFNTANDRPYVAVNVVPSNSPDFSMVVRGRTARINGLHVNVAYSLFVQYCTDQSLTDCTTGCMMDNVYYQQVCDEQPAVDIVDIQRSSEGVATISFSSKLPLCPGTPNVLEIAYTCVEGCDSNDNHEEIVHTTPCDAINGCPAGERVTIAIEDDFPNTAKFQVRQRVRMASEFSDLQPFSAMREFVVYDLLRVHQLEPQVEFIHSHRVRLNLGNLVDSNVAYRKHSIYIYKKLTGTRRLVDSLLSQTTLCPAGQGVCEETSAEFAVEPGYDYSFSVYSYPVISGGKVAVSTTHVTIPAVPPVEMTILPGDHFILATLSGAIYGLSGYCTFAPHQMLTSSQKHVYVELAAGETLEVLGMDLMLNTDYTVTCSLNSEMQLGTRLSQTVRTLPLMTPTLSLAYVTDTTHDVELTATTNKPVTMYCLATRPTATPSEGEVKASGVVFSLQTANKPVSVFLQLTTSFPDDYKVTCVAEDAYRQTVMESVRILPLKTPYVPELLEVEPANNAVEVAPRVTMALHFKYPVAVSSCQHCFFILYDAKERRSTNLYSTAYEVEGSTIRFYPLQLNAATTYQLKVSTQGLIYDVLSNVAYDSGSDLLTTFTVKDYKDVNGDMELPEGDFFPINGVLRFNFDGYLYLNEGTITLNSLSVEASNPCLQITHANAEQTTLSIPVAECVGLLRSNATYVLVLPEGLLQSREQVQSPRMSHVFQTGLTTYTPQVIRTFPEDGSTMVPLDTPVKLYFDQPVKFGNGFLFISEFFGEKYLNSINLPASKATFGTTFPFEVSWQDNLFTLKPYHTYVMSWSEGAVLNAKNEPLAASTAMETVSFTTGKSACSADFLAESIYGSFECTYEENVCKCSQWNIMAVAF